MPDLPPAILARLRAQDAAPYVAVVPGFTVVCQGCGRWVPGYWHKDERGSYGYCCCPQSEKERAAKMWVAAIGERNGKH